ncbi:MAG: family 20 glycosylhydrolase [Chitinophagaceae bacterium]|nr:family 20 glycosylhydrolase [Chitinophagaceae bacterium]
MFYGLVTLDRLSCGAKQYPHTFTFPTGGVISDEPGFAFRGSHLDVARQFYTGGEVSQLIKIMAWNKMNKFHWHLTEDRSLAHRDRHELNRLPPGVATAGAAAAARLGPQPTGGFAVQRMSSARSSASADLGIAVIPIDI